MSPPRSCPLERYSEIRSLISERRIASGRCNSSRISLACASSAAAIGRCFYRFYNTRCKTGPDSRWNRSEPLRNLTLSARNGFNILTRYMNQCVTKQPHGQQFVCESKENCVDRLRNISKATPETLVIISNSVNNWKKRGFMRSRLIRPVVICRH